MRTLILKTVISTLILSAAFINSYSQCDPPLNLNWTNGGYSVSLPCQNSPSFYGANGFTVSFPPQGPPKTITLAHPTLGNYGFPIQSPSASNSPVVTFPAGSTLTFPPNGQIGFVSVPFNRNVQSPNPSNSFGITFPGNNAVLFPLCRNCTNNIGLEYTNEGWAINIPEGTTPTCNLNMLAALTLNASKIETSVTMDTLPHTLSFPKGGKLIIGTKNLNGSDISDLKFTGVDAVIVNSNTLLYPTTPAFIIHNSNIRGKWNSNIKNIYDITLTGNQVYWTVSSINEAGTGTVDGFNISVNYQGPNGSGSVSGKITDWDEKGNPKKIEWNNGVVFTR